MPLISSVSCEDKFFYISKIDHERTMALREIGRQSFAYSLKGFVHFIGFPIVSINNNLAAEPFDMSDRFAWKSVPFSVGDNVQKACLSFNDKLNRFIQGLRQIFLYGILL